LSTKIPCRCCGVFHDPALCSQCTVAGCASTVGKKDHKCHLQGSLPLPAKVALLLIALLIPSLALGQEAIYGKHGNALLPDDQATPGEIALTDVKKICSTKWGSDERAVTDKMKAEVYAAYGTAPKVGTCKLVAHKGKNGKIVKKGCEVDHRISRELGGADSIKNLWPQPYLTPDDPGAYQKDKLENWLHVQVCAGKMTLPQAQAKLAPGDWYAAYLEMEKSQ
jgi:hypothetical protein